MLAYSTYTCGSYPIIEYASKQVHFQLKLYQHSYLNAMLSLLSHVQSAVFLHVFFLSLLSFLSSFTSSSQNYTANMSTYSLHHIECNRWWQVTVVWQGILPIGKMFEWDGLLPTTLSGCPAILAASRLGLSLVVCYCIPLPNTNVKDSPCFKLCGKGQTD